MKIRIAFLFLILFIGTFAIGALAQEEGDTSLEAKLAELTSSLDCYCGCEQMRVIDCDCDTAKAIKRGFRTRLEAGDTVEKIRTDYLAAHNKEFDIHQPAMVELTRSLYCYCGCPEMTVMHCNCETAHAIERDFRSRLETGDTVQRIRADYLAAHGTEYDALIAENDTELISYIVPVVILLVFGGIAFALIRRTLTRKTKTTDEDGTPPISTVFLSLLITFFSIAALTADVAAQETGKLVDTAPFAYQAQLDELMTSVYCYCGCVKETIEVCVCGTAVAIETNFRNRLNAGETAEQIRADYLETHGPQFNALMPAEGINLIAYIAPGVILVLIGGVVLAVLMEMRKPKDAAEQPQSSPVSDADVKQIEAALEKYKQEK